MTCRRTGQGNPRGTCLATGHCPTASWPASRWKLSTSSRTSTPAGLHPVPSFRLPPPPLPPGTCARARASRHFCPSLAPNASKVTLLTTDGVQAVPSRACEVIKCGFCQFSPDHPLRVQDFCPAGRYVHGDVKPENFVMTQHSRLNSTDDAPRLLLLDLGLAQRFRHPPGSTHANTRCSYRCEPDVFRYFVVIKPGWMYARL